MTTPPTAAEVDAFLAASQGDGYTNLGHAFADWWNVGYDDFPAVYGRGVSHSGGVMWVVGYTDNASVKHYEILGFSASGSGSDADIEASSVVTGSGSGEFNSWAALGFPQPQPPLPYLYALRQAYGSVTIRGYVIPAVTVASFTPAGSAVQAWVNNSANWAAAG